MRPSSIATDNMKASTLLSLHEAVELVTSQTVEDQRLVIMIITLRDLLAKRQASAWLNRVAEAVGKTSTDSRAEAVDQFEQWLTKEVIGDLTELAGEAELGTELVQEIESAITSMTAFLAHAKTQSWRKNRAELNLITRKVLEICAFLNQVVPRQKKPVSQSERKVDRAQSTTLFAVYALRSLLAPELSGVSHALDYVAKAARCREDSDAASRRAAKRMSGKLLELLLQAKSQTS